MRGARHDQAVALLTGHGSGEVFLIVQRDRSVTVASSYTPNPAAIPYAFMHYTYTILLRY